jgi:hypothetical protein
VLAKRPTDYSFEDRLSSYFKRFRCAADELFTGEQQTLKSDRRSLYRRIIAYLFQSGNNAPML